MHFQLPLKNSLTFKKIVESYRVPKGYAQCIEPYKIFIVMIINVRGVPAYTQSTQLRTLIFECPKNKNVLNREKCNKNMPHPG